MHKVSLFVSTSPHTSLPTFVEAVNHELVLASPPAMFVRMNKGVKKAEMMSLKSWSAETSQDRGVGRGGADEQTRGRSEEYTWRTKRRGRVVAISRL